ncbi:hypothetical protein TNCT_351471 [Trichonephila clavata]|uniref:Uncharacterized protein n=1 Tax=Trichonephila clavata TaxID=2740835 RepID=A0A8X6HSD3_TRICU|nr:hypothetical protein TNCT_256771 [Trichonephila clavata]GFR29311.1 hypothetical protein TNCT_98051 [Trichonephila clavata]GFR33334.1 hypothetical protein TNCT_351471 [Trichonephila clavata]
MTMLVDLASEFSEELEVLRLPLEKIPLSQRQLQLSQWIHYILMSNNIRVNIRLAAIIQKNVDKLSPPNNMETEVKQWLDALKPPLERYTWSRNHTSSFYLCCIYASCTKSFP